MNVAGRRLQSPPQRGLQRPASGGDMFLSVAPETPGRREAVAADGAVLLSPGLLDLHSFDTDLLLPDMQIPGYHVGGYQDGYKGRSFEEFDQNGAAKKQTGRSNNFPEINQLKAFPEKDKMASVAKIKVVVRKRPLNKKEIAKKEDDIIDIEQHSNSLTVYETKLKVDLTEYVEKHEFVFDAVLDEDVSNDEVYRETVEQIIPAIFQRTKATCFAYGQTGSGKTYTMQPLPLKASQDILRLMHHTYRNQGLQLFVSFFEIYGGKLFDLLNDRRKLCMREDGKQNVCIVGLQEYQVSDVATIRELIDKGNSTRSTGTTGANEESSRSHAILQLAIKKLDDNDPKPARSRYADVNVLKPARLVGKISFIDLAGSERGADTTDNDKQTRIEGAEINKSLLALKECIRALDNDQLHIPFRGSKLTEVLRDSFVGDSRTIMISCISPSSGSCEHTLNTLRYADRVKSLSKVNNPRKDPARESAALPLSSALPSIPSSEGSNDVGDDYNFGWSKQYAREQEMSIPTISAGDNNFAAGNGNYAHDQRGRSSAVGGGNADPNVSTYLQQKASRKEKLSNSENIPRNLTHRKEPSSTTADADEYLNELLKEEENLVAAHRKQVEDTLDIIREEMNLLAEADQPGNQLDDYILRLSSILSQKAAGILELQAHLQQFQRRLNENNVLISSSCL